MRHLSVVLLGVIVLAAGLARAGDNKVGDNKKGIVYPINDQIIKRDVLWVAKNPKNANHWDIGRAIMDPDNPSQLTFDSKGGELVCKKGGGVDLHTEEKFGDFILTVEFMVPKGSNSGVYVMGEYEVQVFDSYGKPNDKLTGGDLGAIYSAAVPKINAAKKPGEWQKFVIDFQAPRFDKDGKKVQPARFLSVMLNDQLIHENVEMKGPTPGGLTGKEHSVGPIMFQGDHGPVAYRNIAIQYKQFR